MLLREVNKGVCGLAVFLDLLFILLEPRIGILRKAQLFICFSRLQLRGLVLDVRLVTAR